MRALEEFWATREIAGVSLVDMRAWRWLYAHPQATPRDLLNCVDFLVPELQRRGRFRTEYEGKTLMENLAA